MGTAKPHQVDQDKTTESHRGAFGEYGRETGGLIERLMGRKPEHRFQYIQGNARFVQDVDL